MNNIERFERPIIDFKPTTIVQVCQDGETFDVAIPTEEIFVKGSFASRQFSCTPFFRIEQWLMRNGKVDIGVNFPFTMTVISQ